jgi:hypothetical protein
MALLSKDAGLQATRVYEGRIRELQKQVEMYKRELKKCEDKHGR